MKKIWRTRLTVAAFPLAALGLTALIYTGLTARDARVSQSWKQLQATLAQEVELAPRLTDLISQVPVPRFDRSGMAEEIASAVTDLNSLEGRAQQYLGDKRILDDQERMTDLAEAGTALNDTIVAVTASAKEFPSLQENAAYRDLAAEVAATDQRFARAKAEFNQAVRRHNGAIESFPMRLFARLAEIHDRTYFRAGNVGQP